MKITLIDNNDSFTRNLEHLVAVETGRAPCVVPHGELGGCSPRDWEIVMISPGPGTPAEYPGYGSWLDSGVPVLGICLGMQIINEHFGGRTAALPGCVHGQTERIAFAGRQVVVARYHSLYCSQIGQGLQVVAANAAGVPMVLAHPQRPLLGYQFHPESFLTPDGGLFIRHALEFFSSSREV